jgi:SH3-like domain-containing protein
MKKMKAAQLMSSIVLVAAFFLVSTVKVFAAEYVSVAKDGVNLRSGPDTKYSVLYELPGGYPLKVEQRKGQWFKVSDFENDQGWIFAPLVAKTEYVILTIKNGNVRSGPGINYQKVGSVVREVILKKIRKDGDWVQIEHPKLKGWLHRKLIWP